MRGLNAVFEDLKKRIEKTVATVRYSSMQTPEQFLADLRAIGREKLPGILIVHDNTTFEASGTVRKDQVTLVLVDRFRADSDERVLSSLRTTEALLELFPADGLDLNGVFVLPRDCMPASPDKDFAAVALGLTIAQGVGG